jgi:CRISPR-associated protein Cas2
MTQRSLRFAVVYDISNDRERRRVDKVLCGWGHRIQKSVFSVVTNRVGVQRLQIELGALELKSGSVLLLRLQAQTEILTLGQPFEDPDRKVAYVF